MMTKMKHQACWLDRGGDTHSHGNAWYFRGEERFENGRGLTGCHGRRFHRLEEIVIMPFSKSTMPAS